MRNRVHIAGRLTATLLVALWATQPVLDIAHAQEHVHRYCPEHRTFEEARDTGEASAVLAGEGAGLLSQTPLGPEALLRLHEGCAFPSFGTRDNHAGPEFLPVSLACLEVSRPATAPPTPLSSLSILATAPKASPPACA